MSLFPEDDKQRKSIPLFEYLTRYFPKAHREVTKVCVVNNVRYNPDRAPADINWARGKSPNQLGSALRHIMERQVDDKVFENVSPEVAKLTGIERIYVLAEAMWRIGAQLELDIEAEEVKKPMEELWKSCTAVGGDKPDLLRVSPATYRWWRVRSEIAVNPDELRRSAKQAKRKLKPRKRTRSR